MICWLRRRRRCHASDVLYMTGIFLLEMVTDGLPIPDDNLLYRLALVQGHRNLPAQILLPPIYGRQGVSVSLREVLHPGVGMNWRSSGQPGRCAWGRPIITPQPPRPLARIGAQRANQDDADRCNRQSHLFHDKPPIFAERMHTWRFIHGLPVQFPRRTRLRRHTQSFLPALSTL